MSNSSINDMALKGDAVTQVDPIRKAAMKSETYRNYSGYSSVNNGRIADAAYGKDYFKESLLGFSMGNVTDAGDRTQRGFDPFSSNNDYEKIRKDGQGAVSALVNLGGQFIAKTAINTAGGIIGGFYGVGAAAVQGFKNLSIEDEEQDSAASLIFDNSFLRATDKATEAVEKGASVFTSQTDQKNSTFGMFSGLETMKNVSDAVAFTAGAVISEVIMQTAGNMLAGSGIATASTRWTNLANKAMKIGGKLGSAEKVAAKAAGAVDKFGRAVSFGDEAVGVGNKLSKIGREADEVSTLLAAAKIEGGTEALSDLAMRAGMGTEAMAKNMRLANAFRNGTLGTRRVFTGSLFEGSLEARQAKDSMLAGLSSEIENDIIAKKIPENEQESYRSKRMAEGEKTANDLGLYIVGLNVGLLSISNAIQFPTIFGKKAYEVGTKLDRNHGLFSFKKMMGQGADGLATEIKGSVAARAGNKAINIIKNPLSEFMEETLQGVVSGGYQNHFERTALASSDSKGLDVLTANYFDDFGKAFKEQYTTTEGLSQGMIGALVGALGLPMMKKNKHGKWRPTVEGGVWKDLGIAGREEREALKKEIDNAKNALDPKNLLGALEYNTHQTKLNDAITREENKAGYRLDNDRIEELQDDKVFAHVANFKDKGLSSYLVEQMEAMDAMTLEEYAEATRGAESAEVVTEKMKEKELKDLSTKMTSYSDAYDKVHKGMNMDKMNPNSFTDKLFKNLTYALATEEVTLAKYDELKTKLRAKGVTISDQDLLDLSLKHSVFGDMTDKEIEDELKDIEGSDKRGVFFDYQSKKGNSFKDMYKVSKSLRKKAMNILKGIENDNDFDSVRKRLEDIDNSEDGGTSEAKTFMQNSSVYKQAKSMLTDENVAKRAQDRITRKNEDTQAENFSDLMELGERYQSKQSKIMDELLGKQKRLNARDLQKYKDDRDAFKDSAGKSNKANVSFLEGLKLDESESADDILNSMSKTALRREESLRAAGALYGLGNVSESLNKIARAEFIANIQNVEYYSNALTMLNRNEDGDDNDAAKTIAYNKLANSVKVMKERLKEFESMTKIEEGQEDPMQDLKETIEDLIENAESQLQFQEIVNTQKDAVDDAIEKTNSGEKAQDKAIEALEIDRQNKLSAEMQEAHDLVAESNLFSYSPKTSTTVSLTDEKNQLTLKKAALEGEIKYKSVTELVPDLNTEADAGFNAYLEKAGMLQLYKDGKLAYEKDKSLILNAEAMTPLFDERGVFITSKENPNAALQVFVANYRVNMNYTKGMYEFNPITGKNAVSRSKEIVNSQYLFTPFFILNEAKAIKTKSDLNAKKESYDRKINTINSTGFSQDIKNKEIAKLDNFAKEIEAIETMANDNSTYQLRKRILIEMEANALAGISNDDYHLPMSNTFSYGNLEEHAEEENAYNNYLISGNEGENTGMDLIDGKSVEGAKEDAIDEMIRKGSIMYVNGKNEFVSVTDGKITIEKTNNQLGIGHLYYRHESNSGQKQIVKLNRQTLSSNPVIMKDLMKYLKMGLENSGEDSNEIQDIDISVQTGEFLGIFDEGGKPTRLKELIQLFAAKKNSPGTKDITAKYLVAFEGKKSKETAKAEELDTAGMTPIEIMSAKLRGVITSHEKEAITEFSIIIGGLELDKSDSLDEKLSQIESALGGLRYYMNDDKFQMPTAKGFELNKGAFKAIIKSGLVTHGFNVKENLDKIYSKKNAEGTERKVKIVLSPIDSGMVSQAVLNHRKTKAQDKAEQNKTAGHMLKAAFGITKAAKSLIKYNSFDENTMRSQFLYKVKASVTEKIKSFNANSNAALTAETEAVIVADSIKEVQAEIEKELDLIAKTKPNSRDNSMTTKFDEILASGETPAVKLKKANDLIKEAIKQGKIVNVASIVTKLAVIESLSNEKLVDLLAKASNDFKVRFNIHDLVYGSGISQQVVNLAGAVTLSPGKDPVGSTEITDDFLSKVSTAALFFQELNTYTFDKTGAGLVPDIKLRNMNSSGAPVIGAHIKPKNIDEKNNTTESSVEKYTGLMRLKPFSYKYKVKEMDGNGNVKTYMQEASSLEEAKEKSMALTGNYNGIAMYANLHLKVNKNGNSQEQKVIFWGPDVNSILSSKSKVPFTAGNKKTKAASSPNEYFDYVEQIFFPGFDSSLNPIEADRRKIVDHMGEASSRMSAMTNELASGVNGLGKGLAFSGLNKKLGSLDDLAKSNSLDDEAREAAMNAQSQQAPQGTKGMTDDEAREAAMEAASGMSGQFGDETETSSNEDMAPRADDVSFVPKPKENMYQGTSGVEGSTSIQNGNIVDEEDSEETSSIPVEEDSIESNLFIGENKESIFEFSESMVFYDLSIEDDVIAYNIFLEDHLSDTFGESKNNLEVVMKNMINAGQALSKTDLDKVLTEIAKFITGKEYSNEELEIFKERCSV